MKKQILLISTGGTIGSTVNAGTINTSNNAQLKLLQLFQQQDSHNDIEFDCRQPLQILSENLVPSVWQTLIHAIEAENLKNYHGLIITHGTDTLAYTACVLSFYFHALNMPMLLVSSDYPLDDIRANGLKNFTCAVEYIRQAQPTGVFVPYQNHGQEMQLHLASRLTSSLQLSSDFYSVQNKPFMIFKNKQFIKQFEIISSDITVSLKPDFNANILLIKPYPALNYSNLNLQNVNAVLHDLYHSGTACVTNQWGEQYSLIEFLKRCKVEQIPVYLAPMIYSKNAYQSTRELLNYGAIPLWNISLEVAYTKILIAHSNFSEFSHCLKFLQQNLANEQIQN